MESFNAPASDSRDDQAAELNSDLQADAPAYSAEIPVRGSRGFVNWIWAHGKWAGAVAGAILAGIVIVELQGIHGEPSVMPPKPPELAVPSVPAVTLPAEARILPQEQIEPAKAKPVPEAVELPRADLQRERKPERAPKATRAVAQKSVADSGVQVSRVVEDPGGALTQSSAPAQELASRGERAEAPRANPGSSEIRSYPVSHDHVKGNCRGQLILHPNHLEFVSEKEKDSRVWDYDQIRNVNLKGQSGLHFDSSEKDMKKLGFSSRSYRFDFSDPSSARDLANTLSVRVSPR